MSTSSRRRRPSQTQPAGRSDGRNGRARHTALDLRPAEVRRAARREPQALRLDFLGEWAKIFLVSVLLFVVIRTFLVEAFKIPSGSMENTLQIGDFLLVNKLVYGAEVPFTHKRLPRLRDPQRGDVIVFE